MNSPPLLEDRVRDAGVFEVSRVDLGGQLFLKKRLQIMGWASYICSILSDSP